MYKASEKYRRHIEESGTRTAHAKIVVDGVEYDGKNYIKKYPSFSWAAGFIGTFPSKSCGLELYTIEGVDLTGKEIAVYRGLEIDGETEWIPMGLFTATADGVKTSSTGDGVTYTGYDRATRFDVEYTPLELAYPTTISVFAQELAFRRGLGFDNTPFPCCDILLDGEPNIPAGTTEREIIRQIAELGGCNAWISRDGELCIAQPRETGEKITKRKYMSLSSKEQHFGGVNTVVLGKEDYDDDIICQDAEAVARDGVIEWRLENNMFAEVDREAFAEYIAESYIFGMAYVPFEVSGCVDDWLFDIGDVVEVQDKNGDYFSTVVLSYTTSDRIKSTISASVPNEMLTNYEIAGSTKTQLRYALLQVDHINNEIRSVVRDNEIISKINQSAEEIAIDASRISLRGVITAEDLGKTGTTVIDGARIDTSTLNVGGWNISDAGLHYGDVTAPDLYLGTEGKTFALDAGTKSNVVFKAGDSFAVCADGCLYASAGEFGGSLTGDVCEFNSLQARDGGAVKIGKWEFVESGLEYVEGRWSVPFDIKYNEDDNLASISGSAEMFIGPYAGDVQNDLTLYGNKIEFSCANQASRMRIWLPNTNEASLTPELTGTCNVGTSAYYFDFMVANSFVNKSTRREKKDIADLVDFYGDFDALRPVSFKMITDRKERTRIGFIAEEIEEVCPALVDYDDDGNVSGLDYGKFSVLLVAELKKLRQRVAELERMRSDGA